MKILFKIIICMDGTNTHNLNLIWLELTKKRTSSLSFLTSNIPVTLKLNKGHENWGKNATQCKSWKILLTEKKPTLKKMCFHGWPNEHRLAWPSMEAVLNNMPKESVIALSRVIFSSFIVLFYFSSFFVQMFTHTHTHIQTHSYTHAQAGR